MVASYERQLDRAVRERRCDDAMEAARALQRIDGGAIADVVTDCRGDEPSRHEEREEREPREEEKRPSRRVEREPSGDEVLSAGRARDAMMKMLSVLNPSTRACFAKSPSYRSTMKLRITAFPGSDHFMATAIPTGPIEIGSASRR